MKSFTVRCQHLVSAALLMAMTAVSLHAADGTWKTASGGSWDDSGKWDGTTIATGSGFTATFGPIAGNAGNYTITVNTARTIGNLVIQGTSGNSNHMTIAGPEILTLAGGSTPAITANLSSRNTTISVTLDGSQGLSTSNSSTLILSGNNIYTGVTTVSSGVLTIGHNNALGATGAGNGTTVSSGGTLLLANGIKVSGETVTLGGNNTNGALQASGSAEWAGNILIDGSSRIGTNNASAQLTVSGVIGNGTGGNLIISGLGTVVLSGVNTYTGTSRIYRGTLKLDGGNDRMAVGTALTLGGTADNSTFDLNGRNQQLAAIINDDSNNSTRTITNTSGTASTLTLGQTGGSASFLGDSGDTTLLTGNLSLVKSGTFNQTLAKTNSYTGNTTINAGTLTLADDATMTFFIGANGVNNRILGTGSLALNGDFIFDLTHAVASNGNSWQIANFATLNESIGGTFTVKDFTKTGSLWTFGDYQFSELTGILSYAAIPEPSTCAALAGIIALTACVRQRRSRGLA